MLTSTGRQDAAGALGITHLGLATAYPGSAGTSNELSAGSYAREATTPDVTDGVVSIPSAVTFASIAEDVEWVVGWDADTAGQAQGMVPLGGNGLAYFVNPSTNVFFCNGHDFADDERVVFYVIAPGGITAGAKLWVINSDTGAGTFQVSATQGGAAVDVSSAPSDPIKALVSRIQPDTGSTRPITIGTWSVRLG